MMRQAEFVGTPMRRVGLAVVVLMLVV
jgi:hypothetical protein